MDPAPQGRAPTRTEQRENWGVGGHVQIAATTDAKQTATAIPTMGTRLKDRASGPTSSGCPTVVVSYGSSAEGTKLNCVFGGDTVNVLLLCVVLQVSAFEMDMTSS